MKVRVRIAPSPTGYPHIGTIWQALVNFAFARKHNGKFIVRIEDTDRARYVPGAENKLFEALDWFGLTPNESPKHGGDFGPYRQSKRLHLYKKFAQTLIDKGNAYYCFCSQERINKVREKMRKSGQPPMYDEHCCKLDPIEAKKRVEKGEKFVIRLKVPKNKTIIVKDLLRGDIKFDSNIVDDQVLLKSDGCPTYHLAVVIDDHLMKISHMVRGEEWLSSAPKIVLIYDFLNWSKPVFIHTPVIRNPDKSKLSKRQGHASVDWYQKEGYLPEAILNFLALLGWSHPEEKTIFPIKEFIELFDLKDLSPVAPIVDLKKLDYINGVYIRRTSDEKLIQLIKEYSSYKLQAFVPSSGRGARSYKKIIPLIKERINKLSEVGEKIAFLIKMPSYEKDLFKGTRAKEELEEVYKTADSLKNWQSQEIYKEFKKIFEQGRYNKKDFYSNLYVAIEGKPVGLPLFESMEILGKEESLKRLKKVITYLSK